MHIKASKARERGLGRIIILIIVIICFWNV